MSADPFCRCGLVILLGPGVKTKLYLLIQDYLVISIIYQS